MIRKTVTFLVALTFMMTFLGTLDVNALTFEQASDEAATICEALGMLQGTGDGVTEAYLASTPQRYQGGILLLRLMGRYEDSLLHSGSSGYADRDTFSWVEGRKYLNYLYSNQEVIGFRGYPDSTFRPYGDMDAKQYYKVMLVALGYEENVDFAWNQTGSIPGTLEMAQSLGMTWLLADSDFTIGDLAIATVEALRTPYKGMSKTLGEKLSDEGIINGTVAQAAGLFGPVAVIPDPTPVVDPRGEVQIALPYEIATDTGYTELIIAVEDVTFKTSVGEDTVETTVLLAGIVGSLDESDSWNNGMQNDISHAGVTRMTDTSVRINVMSTTLYSIDTDEVLTVTLDPYLFNESIDSAIDAGQVTIVDSGAGLMTDPYALLRPEDFMFVSNNKDAFFELATDLDFDGSDVVRTADFSGVLDGNNHTISNLALTAMNSDGTGLFNSISSGTVLNLKFIDCSIDGAYKSNIGFIAGMSDNLQLSGIQIEDCTIDNGKMAGFFVGRLEGTSNIIDCSAKDSTMTVNPAVANVNFIGGGFGGSDVEPGEYTHMTNVKLSNVDINASNSSTVGGLIGFSINKISVTQCSYNGDIIAKSHVGGIMASSNGNTTSDLAIISDSKAYGTIKGSSYIGGIIGVASGYWRFENNYAGQKSIQYTVAAFNDAYTHRILGKDNGTAVVMDNTAISTLKALDFYGTDHSSLFVSDAAGVDGKTVLPLLIQIMPVFEFIPVEEPIWDPGIDLEELLRPLEEIDFVIPIEPFDPYGS